MDSHSDSIKNMTDVLLPNCLCLWFVSLACDTSGEISYHFVPSWEFSVVDPHQRDMSLPSAAEGAAPIPVPPLASQRAETSCSHPTGPAAPQEPLALTWDLCHGL